MTAPSARAQGKLPHGSKAEVAYQLILGKIIDGTYGPGYRLVLDRLASEMGVSAVPVREALRRLEAEGHVDFKRNLGATVCGIDAADYAEGMQTLAILETSATALAVPLIGPADLAAARRANEAVAISLEQLAPAAFSQSNHEFHKALYRACPNTHLTDLVEREWTRLFRVRNSGLAFVPERAREAVAEHTHLMELIEAKADIATIENYVRAHRMRTVESLLRGHATLPRGW
jgi:DNA-binding GntR family transcriptional regulator